MDTQTQAPIPGERGGRLNRLLLTGLPLVCVLLAVGQAFSASSPRVPAAPVQHQLNQPDGRSFQAYQWGDEWLHGWETLEGYTIVQGDNGVWYYAVLDPHGALVVSAHRADRPAPRTLPVKLRPNVNHQPAAK